MEGTAVAASRQWTRQGDLGLISGLALSCNGTLGTLQWEPFPYRDLSFLICELAEKGVHLPKPLWSHHPELWVLESNRGKGMRRPVESSAGFWTLGHMSNGPFCSTPASRLPPPHRRPGSPGWAHVSPVKAFMNVDSDRFSILKKGSRQGYL